MRLCLIAVAALVIVPFVASPAEAQSRGSPQREEQQPAVPQPRQEKVFPLGASWALVTLNGKPVSGERPTLIVDDQLRGRGFAGCNTFSATAYPLREQAFAVGPVAVTRKSCEQGANATERAFLVAFRGSRKWDVVNGQLVLSGVAGELKFERSL
jgi:heat shock protein HslJ